MNNGALGINNQGQVGGWIFGSWLSRRNSARLLSKRSQSQSRNNALLKMLGIAAIKLE